MEAQKIQKQKLFDEGFKIKKETTFGEIDSEKLKTLKEQKRKEIEIEKLKETLNESAKLADKMAREYEVAFKKAAKAGSLNIVSKYPEILKIYTDARDKALEKGWNDDAAIYSSHIKKYTELAEREIKIREIEAKKNQDQKIFEEYRKVQKESVDIGKLTQLNKQRMEGAEDKIFQLELTKLVEKAEKMARDYEIALKKGLKNGKLIEKSPFNKIIEIYNQIRDSVIKKGWKDQILIYTNQIKIYQEKLEKDKKLREIESEKVKKQQEFIEAQKAQATKEPTVYDEKKLRKIKELTKQEQEEEIFEQEIDKIIDNAEKETREYELAIMKGQFDKKCPFLKIAEIYKNLRKKVYARGWRDEAVIYGNQITLYQEKYQKDKRLRELEIQKVKKQQEFEESLKAPTEIKPLKLVELEALDSKNRERDVIMTQALNLIDEAEKVVRNYEVNLKRDILSFKSPYEEVINMYVTAKKMLQKIGWIEAIR